MDIDKVILAIMGGSSFMLWASIDASAEGFESIISNDIIKKHINDIHLYEITGIADVSEDTLHIIGKVFIQDKKVFEAYTAISDVAKEPNDFCDILEKAQNAAVNYLNDHYASFLLDTVGITGLGLDDLLLMHLYVSDMSKDATEASYHGLDITDNSVKEDVVVLRYRIEDTSPGNKDTDNKLLDMVNTILEFITRKVSIPEQFIINIEYSTTTSLGDEFTATTSLDTTSAFNNLVGMFGAFSYYGNTIIVEPEMKSYIVDEDKLAFEYTNDLVVKNIYSTINFIHKVTSSPVDILLKMGVKPNNISEMEDFLNYV